MVAVRVYIEGGGSTRDEQKRLRQGFINLFTKVLGDAPKPSVICSGGRGNTFREFKNAIAKRADALCLLLVDSEGPVQGDNPWDHVKTHRGDEWERPEGVTDEQLHLMVQVMEAWLVADPDALKGYYGQGFKPNKLPNANNVETIDKEDLYQKLDAATKDSKTKGAYDKSHGFALIGLISPDTLSPRAQWAARLFLTLKKKCSAKAAKGTS